MSRAKLKFKLKENGFADVTVEGSGEDLVAMLVGVMEQEDAVADIILMASREFATEKLDKLRELETNKNQE